MNGGSPRRGSSATARRKRDLGTIEVVPLFERHPEIVEGLGVVRLLAGDSVEELDRPCKVSLVHQRGCKIQLAGSEGRVRADELPERVDGFRAVAALHQREPKAVLRLRNGWIERDRPPQARDSSLEITQALERHAQLQMRLRK